MSPGFWGKLKKPILALAPMANVTDAAFRRIIAKYGKPDVMFTEFVSADGLCSAGKEKLLIDLMYSESERPIVAQLFTGKPEKMFEAATLATTFGFDGIDINMGCPDRSIEKSGAGAALMKNPTLARELIRAAKNGVTQSARSSFSHFGRSCFSQVSQKVIPISIKTRLGYSKDSLEEWLPELLAEEPAAITIHARTRKEMSAVPARWEKIKQAVLIRNALKSKTLILGNGDVVSIADAKQKAVETGADGIMLGRAIFGNPFLFAKRKEESRFTIHESSIRAKLMVMLEHTKLFEELLGEHKNFATMKKHYKAYANGFDGAKELRMKLMDAKNAAEVGEIVSRFLENGLK